MEKRRNSGALGRTDGGEVGGDGKLDASSWILDTRFWMLARRLFDYGLLIIGVNLHCSFAVFSS